MKTKFYFLSLLFGFLLLGGCGTEDYVSLVGQIEGTVVNSDTNEPIGGCEVISSSYGTKLTDANGHFSFFDVEPGKITLTYKATGFESVTREVNVTAGSKVTADVTMKPIAVTNSVYTDKTILDFGNRQGVLPLILKNSTKSSVSYTISADASWIAADPSQGTVLAEREATINVSVNRDGLSDGTYDKVLTIETSTGKIEVQILMSKGSDVRPSVNTLSVSQNQETLTTIKAEGAIAVVGSSKISRYGFCYAIGKDPTLNENDGVTNLGDTNSPINFSGSLPNMEYEKEYHIRAYATNEAGTGYGEALLITLHKKEFADIQTGTATNITSVSATLNGNLVGAETSSFDKIGFYYGTTIECNLKSSDAVLNGKTFSVSISGLSPDMDYYYKAFGQDSRGIQYGEVKKFHTEKNATGANTLTVLTFEATNVKENSATLNGAIEINGTAGIKEYGFFYGTSPTPSKSIPVKKFNKTEEISSVSFLADLNDLKEGSIHYFQAYVKDDENKLIRGNVESFTTSTGPALTIVSAEYQSTGFSTYKDCYFKGVAEIDYNGTDIMEAGFMLIGYYSNTNVFVGEIRGNKVYVEEEYLDIYGDNNQEIVAYLILADERTFFSPSITLKPRQTYP